MTYGVSALRRLFYDQPLSGEPSLGVSVAVIVVFAAAMLAAGTIAIRRRAES
jgi:hypothetical protein